MDEHIDNPSATPSVDLLHDQIDAIVLRIFEIMRRLPTEEENPQETGMKAAQEVLDLYAKAEELIDNLPGIHMTPSQLQAEILNISKQYELCRERALSAEKVLKSLKEQVQQAFLNSTSDSVLGLTPSFNDS